ncbi:hypothetical protein RRG08_031165 [Elysia crispata]|uniref:Uncharacterized protein n=1 Tax=Elysia crispata TaxID=231223 RepID=A0AAE1DFA9_9GAST|nr:hypothetical protein RRG08_031165 [Elysia crispata]
MKTCRRLKPVLTGEAQRATQKLTVCAGWSSPSTVSLLHACRQSLGAADMNWTKSQQIGAGKRRVPSLLIKSPSLSWSCLACDRAHAWSVWMSPGQLEGSIAPQPWTVISPEQQKTGTSGFPALKDDPGAHNTRLLLQSSARRGIIRDPRSVIRRLAVLEHALVELSPRGRPPNVSPDLPGR